MMHGRKNIELNYYVSDTLDVSFH